MYVRVCVFTKIDKNTKKNCKISPYIWTKIKMKTENIKIKLIQNINRNYNNISVILKQHCSVVMLTWCTAQ